MVKVFGLALLFVYTYRNAKSYAYIAVHQIIYLLGTTVVWPYYQFIKSYAAGTNFNNTSNMFNTEQCISIHMYNYFRNAITSKKDSLFQREREYLISFYSF